MQSFGGEVAGRFRTNQSGRTCDQGNTHASLLSVADGKQNLSRKRLSGKING
jgi:hypothetical protein